MLLRIGLIGAGRHGSRYIQHLLHDLPGVSLVALCRKRKGERLPSPLPLKRTARRLLPGAVVCRAVEVADACYRSAELGGASVSVSSLRE